MEASDLDRLDSSVKQIVNRLAKVEEDRAKLRDEKQELEDRLKQQASDTNRVAESLQVSSISDEQLQEVKSRLAALAQRLEELEASL